MIPSHHSLKEFMTVFVTGLKDPSQTSSHSFQEKILATDMKQKERLGINDMLNYSSSTDCLLLMFKMLRQIQENS